MKIVYTRASDNGVSITTGVKREDLQKTYKFFETKVDEKGIEIQVERPMTDAEYEARIWQDIPKDAINPVVVNELDIPTDREFRDAWIHDGKQFSHDFEKARDIQLKRLRAVRDPLLVKYDGLQSRANDLNDLTALADLKVKKQQLRDATNALKALKPTSINDIKSATPDLGGYAIE